MLFDNIFCCSGDFFLDLQRDFQPDFKHIFLKVSVSPAGSVSRLALYFDSETEFVSSVDRIFFFIWIETSLKDVSNVTN